MASLSPDRIRSWERRYKLVEPARDRSGVRLYSDDDVARLTLAREATRLGHPIRHVAQLSTEQLEALVDRTPAGASGDAEVVARLIEAVKANDLSVASHILRGAATLMPARELVLEILAPALREAGRQWENGELPIWKEHFLSNQVLAVAGPLQQPATGDARIVFATPPFDRHGFGIALAALLAAARGVAACNLGVAVPAGELIAAARQLEPVAAIVGITQQTLPDVEVVAYAAELDAGLPPSVELVFGGAGAERAAASLRSPRVRAVGSLETFDALCARWR